MTMTEDPNLEADTADQVTEPAATDQAPADPATEGDETTEGDDGPGREAARYRRRLRETETERDGLAAQLDTLRRQIIEGALAGTPVTPEAFWAGGHQVGDLLDDTGAVDLDQVATAAAEVADRFGIQPIRRDLGQGARGTHRTGGNGWAAVLGPQRAR